MKLILFIHGLGGTKKSFGDFKTLIQNDDYLSNFDVAHYEYTTSLFAIPLISKFPKIQSLSNDLKGTIESHFQEYDEIILVCHSMGGLIAKKYLLEELESIKQFKNKVSKVVLYATPNLGSDLAFGVYAWHPQVQQLKNDSDFLEFLNQNLNQSDIFKYINFYYIIGSLDRVVSRTSASNLWNENFKEIENKAHMGSNGVAKPKDENDKTFLYLKNIIKEKKELSYLKIDFLKKRINSSLADADNRYVLNKDGFEDAHIDVEITKYFDYVQSRLIFINNLEEMFLNIVDNENISLEEFDNIIPTFNQAKEQFLSYFTLIEWNELINNENDYIELKDISDIEVIIDVKGQIESLKTCLPIETQNIFNKIKESIELWLNNIYKKYTLHNCQNPRGGYNEFTSTNEYTILNPIQTQFENLLEFLDSNEAKLFLNPLLLISGEALIGKTHIMCHMANDYINQNKPILLLLGHTLDSTTNLRKMILNKLDLSHLSFDLFLKEFQLLGEINNCRSILAIDAINEAGDYNHWKNQLAGLLEEIKQYPNIAVILSVRDITKDKTISEKADKYLTTIKHSGLDGVEFEAIEKMCDIFKIQMPTVPILHKLNYNPGLLYLFFESLQKLKIDQINPDIINPTHIFENIVKSVNSKLSQELNFDLDGEFVNQAINLIVEKFVLEQTDKLKYKDILDILKPHNFEFKLQHLISEGIFSTFIDLDDTKYIFFTYQKLANYFISKHILEKYIFIEENKPTKETIEFIDNIVSNYKHPWNNEMIIESLSTLLPEKYGIELVDICDKHKNNFLVQNTFLNSFIWRKKEAFNEDTKKYLNELIKSNEDFYFHSLDILLKLSVIPNHPYNAYKLHNHLLSMTIPQRDNVWLTFLRYSSDYPIVHKLIDWSWFQSSKYILNNESRKLYGITLMWMLSSNSRYIRDRSTKALVSLFTNHIDDYLELMQMFEKIDEPYILERIYAVAYGITLRSDINIDTENLANYIFDIQFKDNKPYPHILLRDYARGVVEVVSKNIKLNIDLELIYPPYDTDFDDSDISIDDLNKYKKMNGFNQIWWSLMYNNGSSASDFGNYVLNRHLDDWSGKRFDNCDIDRTTLLKDFIISLNETQKELWKKRKQFYGINLKNLINDIDFVSNDDFDEIDIKPFDFNNDEEKKLFEDSLLAEQLEYFQKELKPYLDANDRIIDKKETFDLAFAQRWIFKRIIELGYNPKVHGKIDKGLGNSDKNEYRIERIGKKYQWIAYHELLARVSDNYKLHNKYSENKNATYKGAWEPTIRDIDPSTILYEKSNSVLNWIKFDYNFTENMDNMSEWLKRTNDISSLENIIKFTIESTSHILLDGTFSFSEKVSTKKYKSKTPRKQIYYSIKSYLVKKEDLTKTIEWGSAQNFFGRWMPEQYDLYQIFLREISNSSAFDDFNISYYGRDRWTDKDGTIPVLIASTSDSYLNEAIYDKSVKEGLRISFPSSSLIEILDLKYDKQIDGLFHHNSLKNLVLDPSINQGGKSCLIAKENLLELLDKKGYSLFWIFVAEKNIINVPNDFNEKWLVTSGLGYFNNNQFIENIKAFDT